MSTSNDRFHQLYTDQSTFTKLCGRRLCLFIDTIWGRAIGLPTQNVNEMALHSSRGPVSSAMKRHNGVTRCKKSGVAWFNDSCSVQYRHYGTHYGTLGYTGGTQGSVGVQNYCWPSCLCVCSRYEANGSDECYGHEYHVDQRECEHLIYIYIYIYI